MKASIKAIGLGLPLLACLLVATTAGQPAFATKQTCQQKYLSCQQRCFNRHGDPLPCINRTCNKQFDNCAAAGGRANFSAKTAKPVNQSSPVIGPRKRGGPFPATANRAGGKS